MSIERHGVVNTVRQRDNRVGWAQCSYDIWYSVDSRQVEHATSLSLVGRRPSETWVGE